MTVHVIHRWICDKCGAIAECSQEGDVWDDPVIVPLPGWNCEGENPTDEFKAWDLCQQCAEKEKDDYVKPCPTCQVTNGHSMFCTAVTVSANEVTK
jgi:hypothetical protein